jgi:hypothetical protein
MKARNTLKKKITGIPNKDYLPAGTTKIKITTE